MIKYFPDFKMKYDINNKRQQMVNSWPLDLNCDKAKKILKWKSILKFKETGEMVAKWYNDFYFNSDGIENITKKQIEHYRSLAIKRGSNWAKTH